MKLRVFLAVSVAVTICAFAAHADTVDPAQAIAQKFSEPSVEPQERSFARPGADYEADMLARAQAEELERKQQETRTTAVKPPVPELPAQISPPAPASPPAKLAALPPKATDDPPRPSQEVEAAPTLPTRAAATVLLVLDPDGAGLGIKPDPILCIDNTCWLSNGFRAPARSLPRNQAVALTGTGDMTAESCSGKSVASTATSSSIRRIASTLSKSAKAEAHRPARILSPPITAATSTATACLATTASQLRIFASGSYRKRKPKPQAPSGSKTPSPKAYRKSNVSSANDK